ncbi:DUF3048 domain-containing protein [Bacillus kexueae]|uniref:DUF3048 domain-containing protein n=1 Tax=Aeribacillus kexueae TaxID=2078952 RepID=UPI001FAE8863|nr:DUF3048 domain-containing protein [Bacillus kexueae]
MKRLLLTVVTAAVGLTVACSNDVNNVKEEESSEDSVTQEPVEEQEVFTFPLTGKEAKEQPDVRPFAIMVNNHPKARPQSGLHKADLIYEVLAEGNITRFLAIYQSEQPDIIGPVRSARDYYIDLSNGFDALYISHGWSPSANEKLQSGEADYLNGLFHDGTLFWRDKDRKAPHNSYISYENITIGAEQKGYSLTERIDPLPISDEPLEGEEMKTFTVQYDESSTWTVQYEYDDHSERYKRYSGEELTIDRESNEPVLIDNIFVVEMEHKIIDNYGRRSIDVYAGGKGYLFQRGKMLEVEWRNVDGRILPYQDNNPISFVSGRTWINIVPNLDNMLKFTQS